MTTLADVTAGEQILFAGAVTAIDAAGYHLALYGPGAAPAGTVVIGSAGTITGSLERPAAQVPVTVVTGFAPVTVGDVMCSEESGETMVARASWVTPDGRCMWSSSPGRQVAYPAAGWSKIGTAVIP